jgi:hypothetical protein
MSFICRGPMPRAVAAVLIVTGIVEFFVPATSQAVQWASTTPSCGWPIAANAQTISADSAVNIHNPDTASDYWLMPFTVEANSSITLSGRYPDSRYMSLAVYSSQGTAFTTNGDPSTLTDYHIAPDRDSVNPWQHPARPGGRFTITLRSDVAPRQVNALPIAPVGTAPGSIGLLFYRVYAAHGNPGTVPLPAINLTTDGVAQHVRDCPVTNNPSANAMTQALHVLGLETTSSGTTTTTTSPPAAPGAPGAPGKLAPFARYPTGTGGTVDTDTAYLSATVVPPQNDDVLVIHAKAPTTPTGSAPSPWPQHGEDLRYWSLCSDLQPSPTPVVVNRLPDGKVDEGCRDDSQIAVDGQGYYTIAVGTESQRSAIERIRGVTFLPFSSAEPTLAHKLYMRNMVADPAFGEAIQDVPADGNPASAAAVMGSFYPQAAFCSLATLATGGTKACLPVN